MQTDVHVKIDFSHNHVGDELTTNLAVLSCIHKNEDMIPGRLITITEITWPARSPDLTLSKFFLWGYTSSQTFTNISKDYKL